MPDRVIGLKNEIVGHRLRRIQKMTQIKPKVANEN